MTEDETTGAQQAARQPGWLKRQLDRAAVDIAEWPEWMRREAGLERGATMNEQQAVVPCPVCGEVTTDDYRGTCSKECARVRCLSEAMFGALDNLTNLLQMRLSDISANIFGRS